MGLQVGMRKLRLQHLQLKSVRKGNNPTRKKEQKRVMRKLLLNPKLLLTKEVYYETDDVVVKAINTLTSRASNDITYEATVGFLKARSNPTEKNKKKVKIIS